MTDDSLPRPRLDSVVLDCPDALALGRFYADLLGWRVDEDDADEGWTTIVPPEGVPATTLQFQGIPDFVAPTWPGGEHPQQFHLDLAVPDIDAAEPAVLAAGATRHDVQPADNGTFRVYLDPVGHPFCLVVG